MSNTPETLTSESFDRIWLEPREGADPYIGRQWCQDNQWGDDGIEYVRADLAALQSAADTPATQMSLLADVAPFATSQLVSMVYKLESTWEDIDTAPKTGEEFIARTGPEWASFSCFWDGDAFVHFDIDDGFIHYGPKEWIPMPSPLPPSKVREE